MGWKIEIKPKVVNSDTKAETLQNFDWVELSSFSVFFLEYTFMKFKFILGKEKIKQYRNFMM